MTPLRNNKSFLDSICSFKLGLFNAISEASRILRIRLFSGVANKIFQENLWLSSVLQVQNLWRYSHVLSLAVLRYVSFRRCMFVHKHILPRICHMLDVDSYFLVWKVVSKPLLWKPLVWKLLVLAEIPYCPRNETLSKRFIKKFHELTNNSYEIKIKWITKKVK